MSASGSRRSHLVTPPVKQESGSGAGSTMWLDQTQATATTALGSEIPLSVIKSHRSPGRPCPHPAGEAV